MIFITLLSSGVLKYRSKVLMLRLLMLRGVNTDSVREEEVEARRGRFRARLK